MARRSCGSGGNLDQQPRSRTSSAPRWRKPPPSSSRTLPTSSKESSTSRTGFGPPRSRGCHPAYNAKTALGPLTENEKNVRGPSLAAWVPRMRLPSEVLPPFPAAVGQGRTPGGSTRFTTPGTRVVERPDHPGAAASQLQRQDQQPAAPQRQRTPVGPDPAGWNRGESLCQQAIPDFS